MWRPATRSRYPCARGRRNCSGVATRRQRRVRGAGVVSQHELCLPKKSLRYAGAEHSTGLRRAPQCCIRKEHGNLIETLDPRMWIALKGMIQVNGFARRKDFTGRGWPQCLHGISPLYVVRWVHMAQCCDVCACDTGSFSGEAARVKHLLASLCCTALLRTYNVEHTRPPLPRACS